MGISLQDARQVAINRLIDIAKNGSTHEAMGACGILLSQELDFVYPDSDPIVDEEEAPYIPCDCPACDPNFFGIDEDDALLRAVPLIMQYEVFFQ